MHSYLTYTARRFAFIVFVALAIGGLVPQSVYAGNTFIVSTEAQLKTAVQMANDESQYPGQDTIKLAVDINLTTALGQLVIQSDIVIDGSNHHLYCVSDFENHIFHVTVSGIFHLQNVTLQGTEFAPDSYYSCPVLDNDGSTFFQNSTVTWIRNDNFTGAALWNKGNLTIDTVELSYSGGW
ncbi:MAG TPA: hypothetical protein VHL11_11100, partial [Phototrophicaceae bacterium]|nr:hypothetical protein [Phototrophicaceae bacterium]